MRCSYVVLFAFAGLLFSGCGDAEQTYENRLGVTLFHEGGVGLPSADIATVRFSVMDRNTNSIVSSSLAPALDMGGQLPEIPFGSNLQFHVEGLNSAGATIAYGATNPFAMLKNGDVTSFVIPLTVVGGVTALSAIYANQEVRPTPFVDGPRSGHTVTELPDGRLLVIGGVALTAEGAGLQQSNIESVYSSIEVFDPRTHYFDLVLSESGAPLRLSEPRAFHSTVVTTDGRVIVIGGLTQDASNQLGTTNTVDELTIAEDGSIALTGSSTLNKPRMHAATTRLGNGGIVVVGGEQYVDPVTPPVYLSSIEVLDAGGQTFFEVAQLGTPRSRAGASTLGERVLVSGGITDAGPSNAMDLFAYSGGAGSVTALGPMATARYSHESLTLNPEGGRYVMLAGGFTMANAAATNTWEVFDSATGRIEAGLGGTMTQARADFALVELRNGNLVAAGGLAEVGGSLASLATVELMVSAGNGGFTASSLPSSLNRARYGLVGLLVRSGQVLFLGGTVREMGAEISWERSDIFNPGPPALVQAQ